MNKQAHKKIKNFVDSVNKEEDCIIRIANKYDFYKLEILSTIIAIKNFKYGIYKNKKPEIKLLQSGDWADFEEIIGFYIKCYAHSTGSCMLEYIFILPEYRRKGAFTSFIENLKEDEDDIWINTRNPDMVRAVNKLGFKCNGKCSKTDDLCFSWKK